MSYHFYMRHRMSTEHDPLYEPRAAAEYIRSTKPTMDRWRMQRIGPDFVKIGQRVYYRKSALDCFIEENTRKCGPVPVPGHEAA
jgi:hypothetical protein